MEFAVAKIEGRVVAGAMILPSLATTPDTPHTAEKQARLELGSAAITLRSLLIGSILVCLVCGLTPYNDYVVGNSFLIGSYLPVFMVLAFFVLLVLINAPLHHWWPRQALSTSELAVILLMTL